MASCRAYTGAVFFLATTNGHLPSLSYKTFFPDHAGFSYLLLKASWLKYMQLLQKSYTFSSNLYSEYVAAFMRSFTAKLLPNVRKIKYPSPSLRPKTREAPCNNTFVLGPSWFDQK